MTFGDAIGPHPPAKAKPAPVAPPKPAPEASNYVRAKWWTERIVRAHAAGTRAAAEVLSEFSYEAAEDPMLRLQVTYNLSLHARQARPRLVFGS